MSKMCFSLNYLGNPYQKYRKKRVSSLKNRTVNHLKKTEKISQRSENTFVHLLRIPIEFLTLISIHDAYYIVILIFTIAEYITFVKHI